MRAIRTEEMRTAVRSNMGGISKLLPSLLVGLLLLALSGCGGPSSSQSGVEPSAQDSTGVPELTDEIIRERIKYRYVRDVPEENGTGQPIDWTFAEDEPKEISIVDKQVEG